MTHRRHVAAHCAAAVVIGLLLIAWAREWDARRKAEIRNVRLAEVVNDMLRFQVDQVKAKMFRMEIIP